VDVIQAERGHAAGFVGECLFVIVEGEVDDHAHAQGGKLGCFRLARSRQAVTEPVPGDDIGIVVIATQAHGPP